MAPLISVITVSLNAKNALVETSKTVRNQAFKDFEYIIKDGGSSDGTQDILGNLGADRVVVSPDGGIFPAMNDALRLARGKYVHFLNAGDLYVDGNVLRDVAREMETAPDVDLFYGDVVHRSSRGGYIFYPSRLSRYFLYSNGLCHQAWFLSRSVYLRNNGFEAPHPMFLGDYTLLLKIILEERVRYRHLRRFVVVYDGQGVSGNPALTETREPLREEVRNRMFSARETGLYRLMYGVRNLVKGIVYDRMLFRLYRRLAHVRFNRRSRLHGDGNG